MGQGGCCEWLVRVRCSGGDQGWVGVGAVRVIRVGSGGCCERVVRSGLKAAQVIKQM